MHVLAIEPYYGGSHRLFLDSVADQSRHDWHLATLSARHWKWRMRSSPIAILQSIRSALAGVTPDVVLCSDMLDVPAWMGLASREPGFAEWLSRVPVVTYFHENQWAYPKAPQARADHHYGYTNLLSALASTECWFNSDYNRETFLSESVDFLRRMPDAAEAHDVDALRSRCSVVPPGFSPPIEMLSSTAGEVMRIGWVHRFEQDKRPDRFRQLLHRLNQNGGDFELILLGERGREPVELAAIRDDFAGRILHDGYAETREEYWRRLSQMDLVLSTADHEFFGIAMCEAIWAGAVPIAPDGLCYPETIPDELRYETLDDAATLIASLSDPDRRRSLNEKCREQIAAFESRHVVKKIDDRLERLASV